MMIQCLFVNPFYFFIITSFLAFQWGCAPSPYRSAQTPLDEKGEVLHQQITQYLKADLQALEGHNKEAAEKLSQLLEEKAITPNVHILLLLAQLYAEENLFDEALRYTQEILQREPQNIEAYLLMGKIYFSTNESTKAIRAFEKVIAIDSKQIKAYALLAEIYLSEKKYHRALSYLNTLHQIEKENIAAYFLEASIYYNNLDAPDKAIQTYRRALLIDPDNLQIMATIAEIYIKQNHR